MLLMICGSSGTT